MNLRPMIEKVHAGSATLAVIVLILTGCATPSRPIVAAIPVPPPPPVEPLAAPEPDFEFAEDPFYRLLIAEFAGQRGHMDVAVEHYLALAESLADAALAERATRIAIFARDNDAALSAAKLWVELDPEDMEARQIVAAMFIRHGDGAAALHHLEYVLSNESDHPGNRLRMIANLLGPEEDRATALDVMEQLMEKVGDDIDALLAYALLAIRAEQLDRARDAMNRIVERTELSSNVAMAYLAVLQKQDKLAEAVGWLEHVLSINPKQFGLRLIFARLLADANRYEEARVQFILLSEESPDNTDIILALGLLNLQASRADKAAVNFAQLLELETREDEAHLYLAQIAESRDRHEEAIEHYRAVENGANFFTAQLRLALVMSSTGAIDEALEYLSNVIVENDEQGFHLVRAHGEMLTEYDRLDEAMGVYDAALANGAYNTELVYTRAMLAEKMGRIDVLESNLRRIIAEEPDNAQALNALGYTLADRTERYDEALELITQALELGPDDFYILDSMGWVLYRLGRLEEAVEFLEKARELRGDPEVAAHLGEVLWVMGDRDGARDVWDSALRDTPNDKKLLDVIERLT
ncbi:MAG: tetratricopeptide repeat protein, partial [Gammaproteobacteria bacterium]|nr:tetratricopeptide repeat protein [Gammaproteobacteria bacterium]